MLLLIKDTNANDLIDIFEDADEDIDDTVDHSLADCAIMIVITL